MPLPNLPEDVVRILSFHGPVEMVCEGELGLISEKVEVAPFDSHLVAFLRPGGALAEALLLTGRAEVQARHTEGTYSLRMTGVAHPGIAVGRRSDRASLTPWLPERGGNGLLAAEFIPHRIELSRQEGANTVRYHGPTPRVSKRRPVSGAWCGPGSPRVAWSAPWWRFQRSLAFSLGRGRRCPGDRWP